MGFDNLNYSTESQVDEESIQDKIDSGRLEIQQITKENLGKLKVDILNSNSHLRVRNNEGKIIGKLKDNQVIDFNGKTKTINYKGAEKLFLGVKLKNGKTGFVSADYIKAGNKTKSENIVDKIIENDVKIEKKPIITTPKIDNELINKDDIVEKITDIEDNTPEDKQEIEDNTPESDDSSVFSVFRPTPEENKNLPSIEYTTKKNTIGYIENGKNYIIGDDGEPKLITTTDYTQEFQEALKKYPETLKKVTNLNLILTSLNKEGKDKSFKKGLDKVIDEFDNLDLINSIEKIEKYIKEQYSFIDGGSLKKENIDLTNKIQVLNYIRDELDDYTLVNNTIIEQEFFNLIKGLSAEKFNNFIEEPDYNIIKGIVGKDKAIEITNKLIEKKADFQKYWNKTQDEIINKNVPHFSEMDENIQNNIKIKLKNTVKNMFISGYTKSLIMNEYIEKNMTNEIGWLIKGTEYNDEGNDYIDLYADINGIGDFDFADKSIDWGKEAMIMLATEAAALVAGAFTMGAGTYAVNAAVYGARGYKGIKWMQRGSEFANISMKGAGHLKKGAILGTKAARFSSMTAIEGSAFYGGYGLTQSVVEGKNMYSWEGLGESMAYVGAFKMLGGLYKTVGLELKANIPLSQQKIKLGTQLGLEGTTFSALGLQHNGVLFEPGEWTAETILQAFVMAAAFKGMGRKLENLRFKKSGDKVVVEKLNGEIYSKDGELFISTEKGVFNKKGEYQKDITKEKLIQDGYKSKGKGKINIENNNINKIQNDTIEGASSTPVEFYKHKTTGKTYTKTIDGKFININGRIVNVKPENLIKTKVESPEITSTHTREAGNETRTNRTTEETTGNEILTKKLHNKFKEKFDEHFPSQLFGEKKEIKLELKNENGEIITISKGIDGKFTLSGDNTIYTKKEILKKIKKDLPEYERFFLKQEATKRYNHIKNNNETLVTERGFLIRSTERITERGLEVKRNGKWETSNQNEINSFLNNNPKIEKLLDEAITKKVSREIKDKGISEAILSNKSALIKDIFLGKKYFNLLIPSIITLASLNDYKNIDPIDALELIAITYIGSGLLNGMYMLTFGSAKLIITSKPIKDIGNYLWNNKFKIGALTAFGSGIYAYEVSDK